MKTNYFNLWLVCLFFLISTVFFSCGKKDEQTDQKDKQTDVTEKTDIEENDFNENDEDLLSVDYKEFYDELAPHGEWIEVTDKDIGIDLKKGSASGENQHRRISFAEFFGVKELYAADVSFGAFFIWKPAPNLAVTVAAGEPAPVYVPYSNGSWIYTDAGWYFKAPTPQEEIVHHYGRWVLSPAVGWVWVPGRVWAPAWVDWRENDTYIAWTPFPPGIYIVNNVIIAPPLIEDRYVIIEKQYFTQPTLYKYMYKENKNKIMIKEWRRIEGVTVMNKTVINKGPDITVINKSSGVEMKPYKVVKVKNIKDVKYTDTEINTYAPGFQKVKDKSKIKDSFSKPDKFVNYKDVQNKSVEEGTTGKDEEKVKEQKQKEDDKGKDKEKVKGEDKSKEEKGNKEQTKPKKEIGDDSDMKDGGKNKGKDDKSQDKQKDDKGGKDKGKGKNK